MQGHIRSKVDQSTAMQGYCATAVWITAGQRKIEQNSVKHPTGNQKSSLTASVEQ